jgi:hypothetical protein
MTPCCRRLSQSWQHFLLVEAEEGFLFGAYLLHVDLVVAGVHCLMFSTWRSGSGPQTTASATISSVTSEVACSKC